MSSSYKEKWTCDRIVCHLFFLTFPFLDMIMQQSVCWRAEQVRLDCVRDNGPNVLPYGKCSVQSECYSGVSLLSPCRFRKDQNLVSTVNCWYLVLEQTRRESRDHATLSDIYNNNVIVRLAHVGEDVIRLFKKVRMWIKCMRARNPGHY